MRASSENGKRERLAPVVLWASAALVVGTLALVLGHLVVGGAGALSWEFLSAPPSDAGRSGGIGTVLVSTLLILGVCMVTVTPIGVGAAGLLAELAVGRERFGKLVRGSLDALSAVPSIVFGLFGNALFCHALGMGFSILSGGLTLACMVLPILARTTEQALRSVPREGRLAAAALGLSRTTTLRSIVLPVAAPGIAVGLVLGIGRALAETAALIFTSGYVTRMPTSLLDSGRALSVHVYDLSMNVPGGNRNAYASALVLVALLLLLNALVIAGSRRLAGGAR